MLLKEPWQLNNVRVCLLAEGTEWCKNIMKLGTSQDKVLKNNSEKCLVNFYFWENGLRFFMPGLTFPHTVNGFKVSLYNLLQKQDFFFLIFFLIVLLSCFQENFLFQISYSFCLLFHLFILGWDFIHALCIWHWLVYIEKYIYTSSLLHFYIRIRFSAVAHVHLLLMLPDGFKLQM